MTFLLQSGVIAIKCLSRRIQKRYYRVVATHGRGIRAASQLQPCTTACDGAEATLAGYTWPGVAFIGALRFISKIVKRQVAGPSSLPVEMKTHETD